MVSPPWPGRVNRDPAGTRALQPGRREEAGARRMTAESAPPGTAVPAVRLILCVGRTCSRVVQLVGGVPSAGYSHLASLVAL
jgi:hypothetical protein